MEILSDPTPDMLAMPRFDDGAIDMQELLRRLAEQVVNAVMDAEADQLCGGGANSRNGYRERSLATCVGTLTLRIQERLGMAVVYDLGYYYVLDASGVVLECAGSAYPTGVAGPKVTGLDLSPNSRVTVGEKLPVNDKGQLEAMETVLTELESTNLLGRTSELSVKNTDNIYILTAEGAKIELGDTLSLRTKLLNGQEVLSVREAQGNLLGAKIDVSNGKNAHYIPAILPTVTPTPTTTPTPSPTAAP